MSESTKKEKIASIMLILQKSPLSSYADIAKQVNISQPTAKRYINQLMGIDDKISTSYGMNSNIQKKKTIIAVNAIINLPLLELETHSFLIDFDISNPKDSFKILRELGEVHPYTSYLNRFFGGSGSGGMLIQFNVPKGTGHNLNKLFSTLEKELPIKSIFTTHKSLINISTYPEISRWVDGNWDFVFENWLDDQKAKMGSNEINQDLTSSRKEDKSLLQKICKKDIIILRELMFDARKKQSDIIQRIIESNQYTEDEKKLFNKDQRRQISRRFEFINNNKLISEYRILYDRNTFGQFNQLLFIGKFKSTSVNPIVHTLKFNPPPFRSGFKLIDDTNNYFWWINLPINQTTACMNFLYEHSDEMQIHFLDTKLDHQRSYPIWHQNLLFEKGHNRWKINPEWIVTDPLNHILNKENKRTLNFNEDLFGID